MAALTQDTERIEKQGKEIPAKVAASTHMFLGAWACWNAAGYLVPGADTAGLFFAGVSLENLNNTGAAGDATCKVKRKGVHLATFASTITIANIGDKAYLVDDNTLDLAAATTNDICAGTIVEFVDSTHAWVDIEER